MVATVMLYAGAASRVPAAAAPKVAFPAGTVIDYTRMTVSFGPRRRPSRGEVDDPIR